MPTDLELLQGSWAVAALEADGQRMPRAALAEARIEIRQRRFTSAGMGAEYAGALTLNTKTTPRRIDMKFDSGPEAGNVNRGIYEIADGAWRLCLATRGDARPTAFATAPGSGHALETLRRAPVARTARPARAAKAGPATATATEIEGEWPMVSAVMNGVALDAASVQWCKRVTRGNVTTVLAGPQIMLKAEFTLDPSQSPAAIDYLNLAGPNKGKKQLGIYALEGDLLQFCVAKPGARRPAEFSSSNGDGRTFTVFKRS